MPRLLKHHYVFPLLSRIRRKRGRVFFQISHRAICVHFLYAWYDFCVRVHQQTPVLNYSSCNSG